MRRLLACLAACSAAMLVGAPGAGAAKNLESMFQDDARLLYAPRAEVRRNLLTLRDLGVDRIRVTVLWTAIAPAPGLRVRPNFNAADPDAYPPGAWDRWDFLLSTARALGMDVNFDITGPAPLWANKTPPRADVRNTFEPSPREFGAFVTAVGRRYSGNFPTNRPYVLPFPRVSSWSIWNEPNHSGWLTPQWARSGKRRFERAASLYRELADVAYAALAITGHARDTILVGETAPKGIPARDVKKFLKPLVFLRALYCVDARLRPLRGTRAKLLGCPKKPSAFRTAHPVLFAATAYAHHPYELLFAPSRPPLDRDFVTLASLGRLTKTLDRVLRRYGSRRKLPLYLSEYGYQTKPDPLGVSYAKQAAYLNEADYLAWRHPRVRSLSQFLLVDDGPPIGLTFQSGLVSLGGARKPAFAAYRLPIHVPRRRARRGRPLAVWALLRPAANGKTVAATIEHRARGARAWQRVKSLTVRTPRNHLLTTVRLRSSGELRVRFTPPGTRSPISSRSVSVTVR